MLSKEENELLTQTGPGTACGELMRSYWQPAALTEELPPGGAPLPIRLLGEELVLYRDEAGQPGLLGLHCAHRGADLSYGRLEDGGLRCLYHGWLYDRTGRCLEQPGEPAGSTFYQRIRQTAYSCLERAHVVFAYMGPGEPPPLPAYEFLAAPPAMAGAAKIYHECNYLQSLEGTFDPQHLPFLHRVLGQETRNDVGLAAFEAEDTEFGVRFCRVRRVSEGEVLVRTTNYILPNLGAFGSSGTDDGYSVHWHVPIDDTHHWKYYFHFSRTAPFDVREVERGAAASELAGNYRLRRNKANRYLQDRPAMRTETYAGMGRVNQVHDLYATESAGPIQDRSAEHLATSDKAIIAMRQRLLGAIRAGKSRASVPRAGGSPAALVVKDLLMPASRDWKTIWECEP